MDFDGTFITVEGVDGSGTTTVVAALEEYFDDVVRTFEPSPFWTGRAVRKCLEEDSRTPPLTDFFMFIADRAYHIENTINPALEDGYLVISDRYSDSTFAYQKELLTNSGMTSATKYMDFVHSELSLLPDVTLLIDVDVEESFTRVEGHEKYEKELDFQKEVAENYREIAEKNSDRIVVIDGNQSKQEMIDDAIEEIESFL